GHISVATSKGLELAGVTGDTPTPEGAVIGRDGMRLNGFLAENAQALVTSVIPRCEFDDLVAAIERAGKHLLAFGITSCMDAAGGQIAGMEVLRAYQTVRLQDRLPVRVWLTIL